MCDCWYIIKPGKHSKIRSQYWTKPRMAIFFFFFWSYFSCNCAQVICNHCSSTYGEVRWLWHFCFQCPAISRTHRGQTWGSKTLLFGLTLEIENCPGVRILMRKKLVIPPALRIHSTSNCSALKPDYPPPFTVGMCEGGVQWLQRTGALAINTFIDERIETWWLLF